jgi:hypothetical protein
MNRACPRGSAHPFVALGDRAPGGGPRHSIRGGTSSFSGPLDRVTDHDAENRRDFPCGE